MIISASSQQTSSCLVPERILIYFLVLLLHETLQVWIFPTGALSSEYPSNNNDNNMMEGWLVNGENMVLCGVAGVDIWLCWGVLCTDLYGPADPWPVTPVLSLVCTWEQVWGMSGQTITMWYNARYWCVTVCWSHNWTLTVVSCDLQEMLQSGNRFCWWVFQWEAGGRGLWLGICFVPARVVVQYWLVINKTSPTVSVSTACRTSRSGTYGWIDTVLYSSEEK